MIYFMRAGESGHVKIGWTKNHHSLANRRAVLQTGHPALLVVIRLMEGVPRWGEGWFHDFFSKQRASGEWFEFLPEMLTVQLPAEKPLRIYDPGGRGNPATTNKSTLFTVRLPNKLHERLVALASQNTASMGATVVSLLTRAFDHQGQNP